MTTLLIRSLLLVTVAMSVGFAHAAAPAAWWDVASMLQPSGGIDFTPNGTQPGLNAAMEEPDQCYSCHRGFSSPQSTFMPHNGWGGSMMANAARDPLFWAALDVANKDFPGAGDYCLRCHTPPGWLGGRVVKDGFGGTTGPGGASGCQLTGDYNNRDHKGNDYSGVTCHFCHRMMPTGPSGQAGMTGNANIWVDDATECTNPDGSSYGGPCRRGPYSYSDGMLEAPHGWVQSSYHESSQICGTCHDVSTPDTSAGPLKTLVLEGGVTTSRPMPIERTFSEWKQSRFSDLIFRNGFDSVPVADMPAIAKAQPCQACHMPDSTDAAATACHQNPAGSRTGNLPTHQFAGANTWIPKMIKDLYAGSPGFARQEDFDQTILAATNMLAGAAHLQASTLSYTPATPSTPGSLSVRVRITNLSGHKLPTGYGEGRRMWLNVKVLNNAAAVVAESGAYDSVTGILTEDPQAKVYETLQGIWEAAPAPGRCRIEVAGKKVFHFVLNNCIAKDNRIPPLGFRPKRDGDPNGDELRPVGYSYPEVSPGSGELVNYDTTDYTFVIPAGTSANLSAQVRLNFQIASKEYIEFLRDQANAAPAVPAENTMCASGPNRPFNVGPQSLNRGEFMYQLWSNPTYGKSPPEPTGNPVNLSISP